MCGTNQRGWALVSVLWFLAIMSLMAAAIQELSITSARGENRVMFGARMDAALEAGIIIALQSAMAKDPAQRWRVDGTAYPVAFDGVTLEARVQDEAGRLDLDTVDVTTFTTLLRNAGENEDEAEAIADSILNWRGPAGLGTLHGATDDDYRDAGRTYRQRHAPFQSVAELQLVLGMTPELFARVSTALTVHNKRPVADAATAPRQVLEILDGGDEEAVATTLASRAAPGQANNPASLDPVAGVMGRTLCIDVRGAAYGRAFARTEVVELTGNPSRPYLVLSFNRR